MKFAKLGGVLLLLTLLAACGGTDVKPASGESAQVADQSPSASASTTSEAEADLPSEGTLRTYFDGVSTYTIDSLQEAIQVAQPGSPAAAYATYIQGSIQAVVDGGESYDDSKRTVQKTDDGYKFCEGSGSDETCYEYTDITGADGKVSNFSVNQRPLANRLTVGNGKPVALNGLDATATFIAAFEASTGSRLFVVVSVKSGTTAGIANVSAKYRSSQGRQSESSDQSGPDDLDADSSANYVFAFPDAKIGGTVTLEVDDQDFNHTGTVALKTQ